VDVPCLQNALDDPRVLFSVSALLLFHFDSPLCCFLLSLNILALLRNGEEQHYRLDIPESNFALHLQISFVLRGWNRLLEIPRDPGVLESLYNSVSI